MPPNASARLLRSGARIGLPLLLLSLAFVGEAKLANGGVGSTNAGVDQAPVVIPTDLVAASNAKVNVAEAVSKGVYHFTGVAAQLSLNGVRVEGEPVDFTAAGGLICSAVTNIHGRAVCPGDTKVDTSQFTSVPTTFTATFAGDGGLAASSDTGPLAAVGAP